MSFAMIWPIALIVLSNIVYNISSKQTPSDIHPLASLTVTYLVGAVASGVLYFALNRGGNLLSEYRHLNWTAYLLGLSIVGLEAGSIYMYKAGWNLNSGHLVHSSILIISLIIIGYFFYHETLTWTKTAGILICLVGIYLINK